MAVDYLKLLKSLSSEYLGIHENRCVMFCPTGALRSFDTGSDDEYGIEHLPGNCVKCRSCENICRREAIKVLDDVRVADITENRTIRHTIAHASSRPRHTDVTTAMRGLIGIKEVYER